MAIEIAYLPIKNGEMFHSSVCFPEAKSYAKSHLNDPILNHHEKSHKIPPSKNPIVYITMQNAIKTS